MKNVAIQEAPMPTPKETIRGWGQALTALGILFFAVIIPLAVYYKVDSTTIYFVYAVLFVQAAIILVTGVGALLHWRLAYPLLQIVSTCVKLSPLIGYMGADLKRILSREDVRRLFG